MASYVYKVYEDGSLYRIYEDGTTLAIYDGLVGSSTSSSSTSSSSYSSSSSSESSSSESSDSSEYSSLSISSSSSSSTESSDSSYSSTSSTSSSSDSSESSDSSQVDKHALYRANLKSLLKVHAHKLATEKQTSRRSKLVMRNGRYIPCPEPRGVTSTLWRSTVCPPEPKPIHSKVANKLATASVLPSCMYTAEFPFYSPYFADTVNNSGQMPQEPFINGKNIYVMNKTYKWLTYTSQYATYLYEGRQIPYYKHYGMIADYALNGSCGYDLTNETLTYPFGAWAFCQESYKLYARHQCSRVLVYRDIKHDGTKYKDTDLQLPTYILRKKGWKVKPDRDSNNNIIEGTGEHYVDSPTTLEPWGWHYGALTYPEWFASSPKGLPMAAPEGWSLEDYNPAECVDSLADMTDIKELSGEAIMCCLKNKARAGEITLESKGVEFLQCVPANHYHTLILECDVMYTKFGKHKLKPKGDHCLRDGYEWVENEFYNIYGSAHVLI